MSSLLVPPLLYILCALLCLPSHSSGPLVDDPVQYRNQLCGDAGNYTANSTFQANLNLLLASLSSKAPATGYYNDTKGGLPPDRVYGLALCRGDLAPDQCGGCLAYAAEDVVSELCPLRKAAVAWYPWCLLRYSNRSFFGTPMGVNFTMHNVNSVSDRAAFDTLLADLVKGAAAGAAASPRRFATGESDYTEFNRIYAMAQCTRDLSTEDCQGCLTGAISNIPGCCGGKQGGVLVGGSCSLRYEVYPFYNTTDASPPPPAPASTATAPTATADEKNDNVKIIVAIVVPSFVAVVVTSIVLISLWRRTKRKRPGDRGREEIISSESLLFDLTTLRAATESFSQSNMLGQGGFGSVYKGVLSDGQQIAVKRLSQGSWQGLEELRNEVLLVAKLQHRNLVKLIGYCLEEEEKLLVYEYSQNRSLEKLLYDPVKSKELNWERRQKIVEGIARGLLYLHEDSRLKVIHRDLKPSNILLDAELNPKISDFGLAKLFDRDQVLKDTSRVAGTYGYMAPEYVRHGQYSTKSDVYSFGILLLEIVTGRRNDILCGASHKEDLLSYVWKNWEEGTALNVVDKNMEGFSQQDVLRCIQVGILCVQDNPQLRPNMSAVVLMLVSHSATIPVPSPLAYYACGSTITTQSAS
uniref:Cysteine-rich receptor-like protein kinase 25 n=1 Tax=Anthurium amnicola TaxID=1678845 RepID=A0A1D1YG66_9ARAE